MPEVHLATTWVLIGVEALVAAVGIGALMSERRKNKRLRELEERSRSEADSWKRLEGESRRALGGVGRALTETDFLNTLRQKLPHATSIKILAHTGKRFIGPLKAMLEAPELAFSSRHPLHLSVLLKDPFSEHADRRSRIMLSCEELRQLDHRDDIAIDIRFYSGLQVLRGVFVDYRDATERDCFASNYQWVEQGDPDTSHEAAVTRALSGGFVWRGTRGTELDFINVIENWFDYYWGQGHLHTIAFDFDDTLLRTFEDHISAWEGAVAHFAGKKEAPTLFVEELQELLNNHRSLRAYLERKFIECLDAEELAESLVNRDGRQTGLPQKMNEYRYSLRRSALIPRDKAQLRANVARREISGVQSGLLRLRKTGYPLFVASLTDESIIAPCLKALDVSTLFSGVLGRSDYELRTFGGVPAKTYLLSKLCALAGIPPYRLLFIGDHRSDLEAAENIGAMFLEARVLGSSHLWKTPDADHVFFETFNDLPAKISDAEQLAKLRSEQMLKDAIKAVHDSPEDATSKL